MCVISVWLLSLYKSLSAVRIWEEPSISSCSNDMSRSLFCQDLKSRTYHVFCTNLLIFLKSLMGDCLCILLVCFFGGEVLFLTASNSFSLLDLQPYCDLSPGILCAGPILLFNPHQKFKHWLLLMIFHKIFCITPFFYPHCHHLIAMDTQIRKSKCSFPSVGVAV